MSGNTDFAQHRLIVSDGIYEPNPKFEMTELPAGGRNRQQKNWQNNFQGDLTVKVRTVGLHESLFILERNHLIGSINDLRRTGRAIGYQLIDKNGKTDPRKSFDLAVVWKDYLDYDKLTLDYDTFDPSGALTCSIVLEMPEVPTSWDVSYRYGLETTYNGALQTVNELLEILPEDE